MKNLYLHSVGSTGKYHLHIWKDVKTTREEGKIVNKRNSDYCLKMGRYRNKECLDKFIFFGLACEYITFNKEPLNKKQREYMLSRVISAYNNKINNIKGEIQKLQSFIDGQES